MVKPLAGPRAQIVRFLEQIVDIGEHRRSWRRADVLAVAHQSLDPGHLCDRRLAAERRRADAAEARAQLAEARVAVLEGELARHQGASEGDLPPRKVIEVTRGQFESFALYCEGRQRQEIAAELGIDKRTVTNYVSRVAELIEAAPTTAAALVNRGVVSIRTKQVKPRGKKAA